MASKHDIGWEHAKPVGGSRRTTKCKYCGKVIHGANSGPYYQSMIDTIAEAGPGIKGPTGYQIGNTYLEEEVQELETRKPIINFMIYCDRSMIYNSSVDTTNIPKTTNYIFSLMDKVVEEVGEENVVQVVTDNEASFKATGMLLMEKRKHLFWSPCAAHCIDLMFEDIGSMKQIKETLDQTKMITEFIYNSLKVVNLIKVFTKDRDLLRPGITRFATEFISLESLIRYEADLKRMCTTNEWREFNKDRSRKSVRDKVSNLILTDRFWKKAGEVQTIMEPLVKHFSNHPEIKVGLKEVIKRLEPDLDRQAKAINKVFPLMKKVEKEMLIPVVKAGGGTSGGNRGVGGTSEGTWGDGSTGGGYVSQVDPGMSWAQGGENYYATQDTDHGYRPGIWEQRNHLERLTTFPSDDDYSSGHDYHRSNHHRIDEHLQNLGIGSRSYFKGVDDRSYHNFRNRDSSSSTFSRNDFNQFPMMHPEGYSNTGTRASDSYGYDQFSSSNSIAYRGFGYYQAGVDPEQPSKPYFPDYGSSSQSSHPPYLSYEPLFQSYPHYENCHPNLYARHRTDDDDDFEPPRHSTWN
ncbi:hypothetical protein CK203_030135 [Vitis vinifera]|uniref:DUF659 domain-containing protein n=1 Tax=Vitis vinifera TaxID=29760 RepID=A0A438I548_VITVI|nr:hypothetical protein CK203_030135 [Vitis vinifera]